MWQKRAMQDVISMEMNPLRISSTPSSSRGHFSPALWKYELKNQTPQRVNRVCPQSTANTGTGPIHGHVMKRSYEKNQSAGSSRHGRLQELCHPIRYGLSQPPLPTWSWVWMKRPNSKSLVLKITLTWMSVPLLLALWSIKADRNISGDFRGKHLRSCRIFAVSPT